MSALDEKPVATVHYWTDAHDGPGWYYVDDEYPEEGSVGAFSSKSRAMKHARAAGYVFEYARTDSGTTGGE